MEASIISPESTFLAAAMGTIAVGVLLKRAKRKHDADTAILIVVLRAIVAGYLAVAILNATTLKEAFCVGAGLDGVLGLMSTIKEPGLLKRLKDSTAKE